MFGLGVAAVAVTAMALPQLSVARVCAGPPCGEVENHSGLNMYAWTFEDDGDHLCDGMSICRVSLSVLQLILAFTVWNFGGGPGENMTLGVPCKLHIVPNDQVLGGWYLPDPNWPRENLDVDG